jgi:hypothetical protein
MALDRKIRIGLQVSELLADPSYEGEDVEVRQEMGRAELRKNFGMLVRGRDRPNGILGEGEELSAPDTLVKGKLFLKTTALQPPLQRSCFSPFFCFHGSFSIFPRPRRHAASRLPPPPHAVLGLLASSSLCHLSATSLP